MPGLKLLFLLYSWCFDLNAFFGYVLWKMIFVLYSFTGFVFLILKSDHFSLKARLQGYSSSTLWNFLRSKDRCRNFTWFVINLLKKTSKMKHFEVNLLGSQIKVLIYWWGSKNTKVVCKDFKNDTKKTPNPSITFFKYIINKYTSACWAVAAHTAL